jgi:ribA/ribD-fused uncharacterized protein
MSRVIDSFSGKYEWLSNFYESPFMYRNLKWKTAEHAYQAMKTTDTREHERIRIEVLTPQDAKRAGSRLQVRPEWDKRKLLFMKSIVDHKFSVGSLLSKKLVDTSKAMLIEANTWNDTFWGTYNGQGENHLGQILMNRRAVLQKL